MLSTIDPPVVSLVLGPGSSPVVSLVLGPGSSPVLSLVLGPASSVAWLVVTAASWALPPWKHSVSFHTYTGWDVQYRPLQTPELYKLKVSE